MAVARQSGQNSASALGERKNQMKMAANYLKPEIFDCTFYI